MTKIYCFLVLVLSNSGFCFSQEWTAKIDTALSFSSPKATDLNNDGIKDIVMGFGNENFDTNILLAINGQNGETLWSVKADDELFGTAIFMEINGIAPLDVIISGRNGNLIAVDGLNGAVIWRIKDSYNLPTNPTDDSYFNIYNPKIIEDRNGDGKKDLLISYGGNGNYDPNLENTHGYLMVINSANGIPIYLAPIPDFKETYLSPVVLVKQDLEYVIFGNGGETYGGSLMITPIDDLQDGTINNQTTLLSDPLKGFIQSPILLDLNGDQQLDIVASGLNEQVVALDGNSFDQIWKATFPDLELYGGLTPGMFVGNDSIADIYAYGGDGDFPDYSAFLRFIINGSNGEIKVIDSIGSRIEFSSAISFRDKSKGEVLLYTRNRQFSDSVRLELVEYDPRTDEISVLSHYLDHVNFGSTPLIEDVDQDGFFEIFVVPQNIIGLDIEDLNITSLLIKIESGYQGNSLWNGYLGNNTDALYFDSTRTIVSAKINEFDISDFDIQAYPNPFVQLLTISLGKLNPLGDLPLLIKNVKGEVVFSTKLTSSINQFDLEHLSSGFYFLYLNEQYASKIIKLKEGSEN